MVGRKKEQRRRLFDVIWSRARRPETLHGRAMHRNGDCAAASGLITRPPPNRQRHARNKDNRSKLIWRRQFILRRVIFQFLRRRRRRRRRTTRCGSPKPFISV